MSNPHRTESMFLSFRPGAKRLSPIALVLATLGLVASGSASAPVEAQTRRGATAEASTSSSASSEGVVNIQTATVDELQRLPGIGPAKAAAIVAHRERAPFRRIEDILRVRGIGRATFRRLRPHLTVSGSTTLAEDLRSRTRRAADEPVDDPAD